MSNILERYQSGDDGFQSERNAEHRWKWVLSRYKIQDVLEGEDNRSLGSHWARFSAFCPPQNFRLRDVEEMAGAFEDYLLTKKKIISIIDIRGFVAWKFWEAKVLNGGIISVELYNPALCWAAEINYTTEIYTALSRIEKRQREPIIDKLIEIITPLLPESAGVQSIKESITQAITEVMEDSRKEQFDAIRDLVSGHIDGLFGNQLPAATEQKQITGEEE
jgi:hypothetical protein